MYCSFLSLCGVLCHQVFGGVEQVGSLTAHRLQSSTTGAHRHALQLGDQRSRDRFARYGALAQLVDK
ncbi:hypothetical protein [Microbacterium sp. SLBN-111]|uniref:hypothetical protein n=1 Tax=Microbacterium sp. SLBN-111 TaxID=3377733 RepID=UPI003C751BA9